MSTQRPRRSVRAGRRGDAWFAVAVATVTAWTASVPIVHAVLADADRGLDAMDESHYLLAAQPWASDKAFNGMFGWYTGPLLRLVGEDLGRLRVLTAVLLIGAALLLARSVRQAGEHLSARPWPAWLRAVWPAAAVSAALCYYQVFVRTPSYNWFAALGLTLLAAGLLRTVAVVGTNGRGVALTGTLVAAGSFWTAVGKATTGLAVTLVALAAVAVFVAGTDRAGRRHVGVVAVASAAAAATLAAVHVVFVNSFATTVHTYQRVSGMLAAVDPGHYAPGVALDSARSGLANVLLDRPADYLPLLLLPLLVVAAPLAGVRRPGGWLAGALAAAWLVPLVAVWRSYPGGVPGLGMSVPPWVIAAEAAVPVALVAAAWHGWDRRGATRAPSTPAQARPWPVVLLAGALCLMGACYPVGTNVEYATQLPGGFVVLLVAAVTGTACIPGRARTVAVAVLAIGAILLSAVLVPGTRNTAPYRISTLDKQTNERSIVPGTPPILVEDDTAAWIDGLRALAAANGFVPGSPVLDLTWHPMSVMVLGGVAPKTLIPAFPGWPDPGGSAAYTLRQEDPTVWRGAWLLVIEGTAAATTDRATQVVGLRFPADYERLGTVVAPYDRQVQGLWRPRR